MWSLGYNSNLYTDISDLAMATQAVSGPLECPVCFLYFNTSDRLPKALACLHTICTQCVEKIKSTTSIKCPACRSEGELSKIGINYTVKTIMETLCVACSSQKHSGKCAHCQQDLCIGCLEAHAKSIHKDLLLMLGKLDQEVRHALSVYTDDTILQREHEREAEALRDLRMEMQRQRDELDARERRLEAGIRQTKAANIAQQTNWKKELLTTITGAKDYANDAKNNLGIQYSKDIQTLAMITLSKEQEECMSKLIKVLNNSPTLDDYRKHKMGGSPSGISNYKALRDVRPTIPDYTTLMHRCMTGSKGSRLDQFDRVFDAECVGNMIVVVDEKNHRIKWYDYELNPLFAVGRKGTGQREFWNPGSVAVGPNDELFVTDYNNHRIVVLSKNGEYQRHFGTKGSSNTEFLYPVGITICDDDLFVCDRGNYCIKHFSTKGKFIKHIGSKGTQQGEFDDDPLQIAVMSPSDGRILVNILNKTQLLVFNRNGLYQGLFPPVIPPQLSAMYITDVSVDVFDNVIITYLSGQLTVYNQRGTLIHMYGSTGTNPGQFMHPMGVTVNNDHNLMVVCDSDSHKIVRLDFQKF